MIDWCFHSHQKIQKFDGRQNDGRQMTDVQNCVNVKFES
ncbi:MAG: hypothetical protein ACI8RD_011308 [Bacillariaceae sp.]|jgi:hypothetical protein